MTWFILPNKKQVQYIYMLERKCKVLESFSNMIINSADNRTSPIFFFQFLIITALIFWLFPAKDQIISQSHVFSVVVHKADLAGV